MQVFYDQDGNIVDLSKIITILYNLHLYSDDGLNDIYVLRNQQYTITGYETRIVTCENIATEYQNTSMKHYTISRDDITYYIPEVAVAFEYNLRAAWQQDKRTYERKLSSQPKDYVRAYKDVTGIDLDERGGRQHNGTLIEEEHKGKDMFDNDYGKVETDSTDSYEYKDRNNL